MNVNLIPLNTKGIVNFEGKPNLERYIDDNILGFQNFIVKGFILDNGTDDYKINLSIKGNLILKSSINNKEVNYPISISNEEFINNLVEKYKISTNILDILPIIWENILLEIPIRVVNPDDEYEKSEGNGWEVISE